MTEHRTNERGEDPERAADHEHNENVADPDLAESLRRSNPNATGAHGLAGGMGVSSERVGHVAPDTESTDGMRDVSPRSGVDPDAPPEQTAGGREHNPARMGRKSEWPSADPRSHGKEPETRESHLRGN